MFQRSARRCFGEDDNIPTDTHDACPIQLLNRLGLQLHGWLHRRKRKRLVSRLDEECHHAVHGWIGEVFRTRWEACIRGKCKRQRHNRSLQRPNIDHSLWGHLLCSGQTQQLHPHHDRVLHEERAGIQRWRAGCLWLCFELWRQRAAVEPAVCHRSAQDATTVHFGRQLSADVLRFVEPNDAVQPQQSAELAQLDGSPHKWLDHVLCQHDWRLFGRSHRNKGCAGDLHPERQRSHCIDSPKC